MSNTNAPMHSEDADTPTGSASLFLTPSPLQRALLESEKVSLLKKAPSPETEVPGRACTDSLETPRTP